MTRAIGCTVKVQIDESTKICGKIIRVEYMRMQPSKMGTSNIAIFNIKMKCGKTEVDREFEVDKLPTGPSEDIMVIKGTML